MKNLIKQYWFWAWLLVGLFLPLNVFAYDGYATVSRGKYFYSQQSTILNTNWYNLTNNSFNNNILSFPSGYTYFINGAEYVAAINFNGEQSFRGSVQIPVVVQSAGGVNDINLVNQSNFHLGIDTGFGVYNLNPNITTFDSYCDVAIQQSQTQVIYTYCTYFVEFNFVSSSPIYGSKNLNFGIFGNSPSQGILTLQDNVFYVSYPLNVWSSSLNLNPNFFLFDNSSGGGGSSSTDLTNVENKLDDVNDNLQNIDDSINDLSQNQQDTTNAVEDLNDSLTDDSGVSNSDLEDFFEGFHNSESRPLRDLLFLLLKPFELLVEHSSDSCSNYTFGSLYGSTLSLPCINLEEILGSRFYDIIDYLCSFAILYALFKFVAKSFHGLLNLNDVFNDFLYDHLGGR